MPIFCPALTQWGSRDHKSGCHCCSPGVSACLWALLLLTKTHTNCFRTQGPTCLSSGENFPDDRPTCLLETHIASVSRAGINFAAGQSLVALKIPLRCSPPWLQKDGTFPPQNVCRAHPVDPRCERTPKPGGARFPGRSLVPPVRLCALQGRPEFRTPRVLL